MRSKLTVQNNGFFTYVAHNGRHTNGGYEGSPKGELVETNHGVWMGGWIWLTLVWLTKKNENDEYSNGR